MYILFESKIKKRPSVKEGPLVLLIRQRSKGIGHKPRQWQQNTRNTHTTYLFQETALLNIVWAAMMCSPKNAPTKTPQKRRGPISLAVYKLRKESNKHTVKRKQQSAPGQVKETYSPLEPILHGAHSCFGSGQTGTPRSKPCPASLPKAMWRIPQILKSALQTSVIGNKKRSVILLYKILAEKYIKNPHAKMRVLAELQ